MRVMAPPLQVFRKDEGETERLFSGKRVTVSDFSLLL